MLSPQETVEIPSSVKIKLIIKVHDQPVFGNFNYRIRLFYHEMGRIRLRYARTCAHSSTNRTAGGAGLFRLSTQCIYNARKNPGVGELFELQKNSVRECAPELKQVIEN